ncbi:D-Lactate dehydrogenase [Lactiplantibacillus plantarum]|nr:D-Lactate dehydrogenase [Lactiplantibacillus plantarum]
MHLHKIFYALLIKHYKKNDPTNSFNPGVGKQTMSKYWGEY